MDDIAHAPASEPSQHVGHGPAASSSLRVILCEPADGGGEKDASLECAPDDASIDEKAVVKRAVDKAASVQRDAAEIVSAKDAVAPGDAAHGRVRPCDP